MSSGDLRIPRIHRIVFDTSTLVSAALRQGSIPYQALHLGMTFCTLCASQQTLDELRQVLFREKFDGYSSRDQRGRFILSIEDAVHIVLVSQAQAQVVVPLCRDEKDNKFLALALAAEADAIVSSDQDLLVLTPWNGIPILTPAAFLKALVTIA